MALAGLVSERDGVSDESVARLLQEFVDVGARLKAPKALVGKARQITEA